jgi:hypothetical protein
MNPASTLLSEANLKTLNDSLREGIQGRLHDAMNDAPAGETPHRVTLAFILT